MKRTYNLLLTALVVLLASSCAKRQVSMHTYIEEDGSCSRVFCINVSMNESSDSMVITETPVDFFVDSATMVFDDSWTKTWTPKGGRESNAFPVSVKVQKRFAEEMKKKGIKGNPMDTIEAQFQQKFASVDEMCEKSPLRYNGKQIMVKGELEKTFKWFYTEYTYTETYSSIVGEFVVPPTKYMTEKEAELWFVGKSNTQGVKGNEMKLMLDGIEENVDKWLAHNFMYDSYEIIAQHYDMLQNAPMGKEDFIAKRDSFIQYSVKNYQLIYSEKAGKLWNDFFHSDVYSKLQEQSPVKEEIERMFMSKYWTLTNQSIDYTLYMPGGTILAHNGMVSDGRLHYPLSLEHLIPHDYVITATSNVKNMWAFAVTLLVICLAIGSFIYKKKTSIR